MLRIRAFESDSLSFLRVDTPATELSNVSEILGYCSNVSTDYALIELRYCNAVTRFIVLKQLAIDCPNAVTLAVERSVKDVKKFSNK